MENAQVAGGLVAGAERVANAGRAIEAENAAACECAADPEVATDRERIVTVERASATSEARRVSEGGEGSEGEVVEERDVVGVGPWQGDWPTHPQYDPELLARGDRRNVVDRYRYWRVDAIVEDLDTRRHGFHVAIENWQHDFNIGTVVRNANAFLAAGVHIVGRRRWNRRGAMVTDRYQRITHHPSVEDLVSWAEDEHLDIVGIDNLPGACALESTVLPSRCVLLFGQEGPGLSRRARLACSSVFSIAQYGSTRSINAGVASGIAMHAWVRAHAGPPPDASPPASSKSTVDVEVEARVASPAVVGNPTADRADRDG